MQTFMLIFCLSVSLSVRLALTIAEYLHDNTSRRSVVHTPHTPQAEHLSFLLFCRIILKGNGNGFIVVGTDLDPAPTCGKMQVASLIRQPKDKVIEVSVTFVSAFE